jgi:hypothetical protein
MWYLFGPHDCIKKSGLEAYECMTNVLVDGSEWSVSCSGSFIPNKRTPGIQWIVGPRCGGGKKNTNISIGIIILGVWLIVNLMTEFYGDNCVLWIGKDRGGSSHMLLQGILWTFDWRSWGKPE